MKDNCTGSLAANGEVYTEKRCFELSKEKCNNCGKPMYDTFSGMLHNSETCMNRQATAVSTECA